MPYVDCDPWMTVPGIIGIHFMDAYGYLFSEFNNSEKAKEIWWKFVNDAPDGTSVGVLFQNNSRGKFDKAQGRVMRVVAPKIDFLVR